MNSPELQKIGLKLRQLRESEGLTQTQFSKKVQLSQAAISQFEEGKRIPSTKALQKIAAGIGISIDNLLGSIPEQDDGKNAAIQSLVAKLKNEAVRKEEIIALNRYIDVRLDVDGENE